VKEIVAVARFGKESDSARVITESDFKSALKENFLRRRLDTAGS
jgi:hypothetical protein